MVHFLQRFWHGMHVFIPLSYWVPCFCTTPQSKCYLHESKDKYIYQRSMAHTVRSFVKIINTGEKFDAIYFLLRCIIWKSVTPWSSIFAKFLNIICHIWFISVCFSYQNEIQGLTLYLPLRLSWSWREFPRKSYLKSSSTCETKLTMNYCKSKVNVASSSV